MSDINLIVGQEPEYSVWLVDLKRQIHEAQTRAVLAVNSELVLLYSNSEHLKPP